MKCEYQAAMNQIHMPKNCEARVLTALERQETLHRRRPLGAVALTAAAVAALLCGSALAVGYQTGVLDFFFRGDASILEPYVQHPNSVSNEDYRLSVDSILFDGRSVYAVVTLEGLNRQAVEDLKSNRVIANSHLEDWGQQMVDNLLESGGAGPDTFLIRGAAGVGCRELPAPDETSRAWMISGVIENWSSGDSIALGTNVMGWDHMICMEPEHSEPLNLNPNTAIPLENGAVQTVCEEFTIYMTGVSGTFQSDDKNFTLESLEDLSIKVTLQDGSVLSGEDLGIAVDSGSLVAEKPSAVAQFNYQFETPVDPAEIIAVSINGVELTP